MKTRKENATIGKSEKITPAGNKTELASQQAS